jgi:hypothetical protein
MKRRQFLTTLILGFVMLLSTDMKAQSDAFFSQQDVNNRTQQQKAISYGNVYTDQSGVGIDNFVNDTPLSGGLFALTATGLVYLIGKRRKENK